MLAFVLEPFANALSNTSLGLIAPPWFLMFNDKLHNIQRDKAWNVLFLWIYFHACKSNGKFKLKKEKIDKNFGVEGNI